MAGKHIRRRAVKFALIKLLINLLYSLYNGIIGIYSNSWWFLTVSAYYIILSVMSFSILMSEYRNRDMKLKSERFILNFSGIMFFVMSWVLSGMVYLTLKLDVAVKYNEIVMITIAAYTFTKTVIAIINLIKSKKYNSSAIIAIRNISCADAAVSIFTMQKSMLVSFEEMSAENIFIFNVLTGTGVCLIVMGLGINMIIKNRKENDKNGKIKIS